MSLKISAVGHQPLSPFCACREKLYRKRKAFGNFYGRPLDEYSFPLLCEAEVGGRNMEALLWLAVFGGVYYLLWRKGWVA